MLLISIVDAYDAMTHHRPYRGALSKEEHALKELKRFSGTRFDQKPAEIFIELIKSKSNCDLNVKA